MNFFQKIGGNEKGQVLVLTALLMVVLTAFAGLALDAGMLYLTKTKLQNAADAAALAGAKDLPNSSAAKSTADSYAQQNGSAVTTTTTPYNGNSKQIEVVCKKKVKFAFASLLGLTDTDVSARAVAKGSSWAGEALPFINLDSYGSEGSPLNAWNKVNPGDKERIHNDDLTITTNSIVVDYEDGITFKKGKDLSGIATALKNILKDGNTVYLFAIRDDLVGKSPYNKLKEGYVIPIEDTVLLECKVVGNYVKNNDTITLELESIYNYDSMTKAFPVTSASSQLVE